MKKHNFKPLNLLKLKFSVMRWRKTKIRIFLQTTQQSIWKKNYDLIKFCLEQKPQNEDKIPVC